ncbi:MAG: alkaline phosphatase D family protein [Proteobacteria bacterium]|nr:alkaline phosphatase D family protein [Pseudomonadota bacterium]
MSPPKESPTLLHTIAFGSCNRQNLPQPMWRKLIEEKPELWIWMGDVIYADTEDMDLMKAMYQEQLQQPEYAAFLASQVPVIGIYDDHDLGENDVGGDFPQKKASKALFLDFIGEPKDSPRREQAGVYASYHYGPAGKRVKILLLDTRYNRQDPGKDSDILGTEQWDWLNRELKQNDADLLLIVSGIEVLAYEHDFEKWANFPKSRQRLLEMLDQNPIKNVLLMSGDRHIAEISKLKLASGRELLEVTSSGLTHSYSAFTEDRNRNSLRVGGVLPRLNYGILKIDWEGPQAKVSVEVRDINRQVILQEYLPILR